MISKNAAARCVAAALGGLMLAGVGSHSVRRLSRLRGQAGVDVKVDIAEVQNGALSLTVENDETTLTESGSTAENRQFIGALPNVTVTDTRTEVPSGVFWYVTGQASNFVGTAGQSPITPDHLGWSPALVTNGNGEVAAGDEVKTSLDESPNNVGLVGEELLALSLDSPRARPRLPASGRPTLTWCSRRRSMSLLVPTRRC